MFEIIARVICGLLPIIWGVSLWAYVKKKIFETMCVVLSVCFFTIGLIDLIFFAMGLF